MGFLFFPGMLFRLIEVVVFGSGFVRFFMMRLSSMLFLMMLLLIFFLVLLLMMRSIMLLGYLFLEVFSLMSPVLFGVSLLIEVRTLRMLRLFSVFGTVMSFFVLFLMRVVGLVSSSEEVVGFGNCCSGYEGSEDCFFHFNYTD